jgi:hypothetical protein
MISIGRRKDNGGFSPDRRLMEKRAARTPDLESENLRGLP